MGVSTETTETLVNGGTKKLVVTRRSDDYHVCINGNQTLWGCGKSIDEAIGDCVRTHSDELGIEIEYPTTD